MQAYEMFRWVGMLHSLYNMMKHGPVPSNLEDLLGNAFHILDNILEGGRRRRKKGFNLTQRATDKAGFTNAGPALLERISWFTED